MVRMDEEKKPKNRTRGYLLKGDSILSDVYDQRKDPDGFLYVTYTDETTLGGNTVDASMLLSI